MIFRYTAIIVIYLFAAAIFANTDESSARQDMPVPSYGSGSVEVRIYSDYFCPPCQQMEPRLERVLKDLVNRRIIRLILVDVPSHAGSPLFARFFLYALEIKNDVHHSLEVRNILFQAAQRPDIVTGERMEEFLKKNNISYSIFNPQPILKHYNSLIREDHVSVTPTCVIIQNGEKRVFIGQMQIMKVLKDYGNEKTTGRKL